MNEPLDLYMMITIPRFRTYSQKMAHLLSIIQIFKHLLEMYKMKSNLSESCLTNLFSVASGNYNLPSQSDFRVPGTNTDFYGTNSIGNFGSVIRNSLPNDLFVILIYLKRQYGYEYGNQLTVLADCVRAI